jgi:hypothetical protein
MSTQTTKFASVLAADDATVKAVRSQNLSDQVLIEATSLTTKLTRDLLKIDAEINRITDLAPESKDSLRPGGSNFNPEQWVARMFELRLDRREKQIELDEALTLQKEWL